jgi:acyl carrier protein
VELEATIRADVVEFVVTNYLFGDTEQTPADEESLVEGGIIDSTGILELILFLEERFGVEVSDAETIPQNLGSIANIVRFVGSKSAAA